MKTRYWFLLLLSALLLVAWLARVPLAELAAKSVMHSYGLETATAEIERLETGRLHIRRVAFTAVRERDVFRLQAENLDIRYTLRNLLRGRVERVAVGSMAISHDAAKEPDGAAEKVMQPAVPLDMIAVTEKALREYVVADSMVVQHLVLDGGRFGILREKVLRLRADAVNDVVTAELSIAQGSTAQEEASAREILFTMLTPDKWSAQLQFPQRPGAVPLQLELVFHAQRIDGSYRMEPGLLTEWLQLFASIRGFDATKNISGTFGFDFAGAERIRTTAMLTTDHFAYDAYRADAVAVRLIAETPVEDPFGSVQLVKGSYIKADHFARESFSVADARIALIGNLAHTLSGWRFDGGASAPAITVSYDAQSARFSEITAAIEVNRDRLSLSGDFSTADTPGSFSFSLEHRPGDASGTLAILPKSPVVLDAEAGRLSRLWSPWPYTFDLLKGKLKLEADARWSEQQDFSLDVHVRIDDAAGHYGEIVFAGLTLEHRLGVLPGIRSTAPGEVELAQLDSGVIARNLRTKLLLEPASSGPLPRITAQDLYGEIFGGSFGGDAIVFDLNRDTNRFAIEVKDIDLAAIVATQQFEDIEVTGTVDGAIPVTVSEEGVFIEDGVFISDVRAGTIRYTPGTGTGQLKQNPLTRTALDALRDFRYSDLEADVNFRPDGTLTVNVQLKGTSPELDTKRPVHLNINTEQNLLSLLKSLRYAESAGASIEQKVRDRYRQTSRSNKEDRP